ncbi:MAG TPA: adenosylmethionine decarboxylase [Xanthobacteraceae bacterium]|nr:adenosylmethionine decarboxylase [Xanthobacteraceae bacterium]
MENARPNVNANPAKAPLGAPARAARTSHPAASRPSVQMADRFVERDGLRFAGTHLIVDLWDACELDDLLAVEAALRSAAQAAGATLLSLKLHGFASTGGITGVAILAESHISIHTWPECSYAAVDVFMCGEAKPARAIEVLRRAFQPGRMTVVEHKRGLMP